MFKSFRFKLFIVFLFTSILISGTSIYLVYLIGIQAQLDGLRKTVMAIASTTALMLDPEEHKKIDPHNPIIIEPLNKVNRTLYDVWKTNPDIRFAYTFVKTDDPDKVDFVGDSESPNKNRWTEQDLKEVTYDISHNPEMKQAFMEKAVSQNFYTDNWGTWLSGFAPLKDKNGHTVAAVGIDMSAEKVLEFRNNVKIWTCIILGVNIFISLLLSMAISSTITIPLMKITEYTKMIADGDFKTRINITSGDEINVLADSFNDMIDKLDRLFFELHTAQRDLKDAYIDSMFRLAMAVEYKDETTALHLKRVSTYSYLIAQKLGLPPEDIENIKFGSPMHDIGKIGIPDKILNKEGKLTDEEYKIIKEHPFIGYNLLKGSNSPYLRAAAIISLNHHEHYDGTGYPQGLKGEDIHVYGRIVALADVFDALMSKRPYKEAFALDEVLNIIKSSSGKHFDPHMVDVFFNCLDDIKKALHWEENQ